MMSLANMGDAPQRAVLGHHLAHVVLGLAVGRHAAAMPFHRAFARVVGGQHQGQVVAEALLQQVEALAR